VVWCIGNIAGDGPAMRDAVLAAGACHRVLPYLFVKDRDACTQGHAGAKSTGGSSGGSESAPGWPSLSSSSEGQHEPPQTPKARAAAEADLGRLRNMVGRAPPPTTFNLRDSLCILTCVRNSLHSTLTSHCTAQVWAASNLCRGKPLPALDVIRPLIPVLAAVLLRSRDEEVLADSCWALAYLCDGDDERIASVCCPPAASSPKKGGAVESSSPGGAAAAAAGAGAGGGGARMAVDTSADAGAVLSPLKTPVSSGAKDCEAVSGVVPRLVALLRHPSTKIVTPALRAVGNIVSGSEAHTQRVLDAGALAAITPLIRHPKQAVCKEACWALSNIAGGSQQQVAALAREADLLGAVVRQVQ
jgi:hypothetical protein